MKTENLPARQEKNASGTLSLAIKQELPVASCPHEQLRQSVAYGIMLSGLSAQNMPSKIESSVIDEFVRQNYPDYTPDEIRYAFEKAMARRFDVDAKCYGNFSCEYIGRILSAYEAWAGEGEIIRPPECGSMMYGDSGKIQAAYERFQNGEPKEYYPKFYYNRMKEDKLCPALSFKLSKRVYQWQIAVLKGFAHWAAKGQKMLYMEVELPVVTPLSENLLKAM